MNWFKIIAVVDVLIACILALFSHFEEAQTMTLFGIFLWLVGKDEE